MAGDADGRQRYQGADDELRQVLDEWVAKPKFVSYGEGDKAKVEQSKILPFKAHICKLQKLQYNLSFTQQQVERVLLDISVAKEFFSDNWSDDDRQGWAQAYARKARTMLRHVAQGLLHKVKWAMEIVEEPGYTLMKRLTCLRCTASCDQRSDCSQRALAFKCMRSI